MYLGFKFRTYHLFYVFSEQRYKYNVMDNMQCVGLTLKCWWNIAILFYLHFFLLACRDFLCRWLCSHFLLKELVILMIVSEEMEWRGNESDTLNHIFLKTLYCEKLYVVRDVCNVCVSRGDVPCKGSTNHCTFVCTYDKVW